MAEITYRKATKEDALHVARHMRAHDIAEVTALGATPEQATVYSIMLSDEAYTGLVNGEVAILFGWVDNFVKGEGEIWALGTDKLFTVPRDMLKEGRKIVADFLTKCPALGNWIGAENIYSINWLKHLGFTISEPESHGLHGEMFRKIGIERKEN
jgi:hypothetical protein